MLQGIVVCGVCGDRMTVRYHVTGGQLVAHYMCQRRGIEAGKPICQHVPGAQIDAAVGQRLIESLTPLNLDVALAVEQELQSRLDEADTLRHQQVERARYEADLARRRYMRVDPDNRLVADSLEAQWNDKLRSVQAAEQEYERHRQADRCALDEQQKAAIHALALAHDFPRVWNDPDTPPRERKRLLRLLIEDVTLIKGETISVHIRFKGGATQTQTLGRPKNAWQLRHTDPQVIEAIDDLLNHHTEKHIATRLNEQGLRSGTGNPFNRRIIAKLRDAYGLKPRYDRLRDKGMLTKHEVAKQLDVSVDTVKIWRRAQRLKAHAFNDKGEYLYEPLDHGRPTKYAWQWSQKQARAQSLATDRTNEVQYET